MTIRRSFEVSERTVGLFGGMMVSLGIEEKDLLNCSLTLLLWYIQQLQEGRIVASVDERRRKYKELRLSDLKQRIHGDA